MTGMRERDLSELLAALLTRSMTKKSGRGSNRDLSKCGTRADAERLRSHSRHSREFS